MVTAFYAGTNSGFLLRDRTEGAAASGSCGLPGERTIQPAGARAHLGVTSAFSHHDGTGARPAPACGRFRTCHTLEMLTRVRIAVHDVPAASGRRRGFPATEKS